MPMALLQDIKSLASSFVFLQYTHCRSTADEEMTTPSSSRMDSKHARYAQQMDRGMSGLFWHLAAVKIRRMPVAAAFAPINLFIPVGLLGIHPLSLPPKHSTHLFSLFLHLVGDHRGPQRGIEGRALTASFLFPRTHRLDTSRRRWP
jgi:hypothetical protein